MNQMLHAYETNTANNYLDGEDRGGPYSNAKKQLGESMHNSSTFLDNPDEVQNYLVFDALAKEEPY